MRISTLSLVTNRYVLILCLFLLSNLSFSQVTVGSYDFIGGATQGWTLGGFDGSNNNNSNSCGNFGALYTYYDFAFSASSYVASPNVDLTPYTDVDFSFCNVNATNHENGDGFDLQYFDGTSWFTIGTYRRGVDYNALGSGNPNSFSVSINSGSYTFASNSSFRFVGRSGSDEWSVYDDVLIQGYLPVSGPEIQIQGNATTIADGDVTPNVADDTDFGSLDITSGTNNNVFTIQNINTGTINLTGASPYVTISGTHAADFTLATIPANAIGAGASTTFSITFNPSGTGVRSAAISIANDDSNENPYNFSIQGTGTDPCGGIVTTFPYSEGFESDLGLFTQDAGDDFDWTRNTGGTPSTGTGPSGAGNGSYYLYTEASGGNTNNTSNIESPCFDLTGLTNPEFLFSYHMYGVNMGTLNVDLSTDTGVTYPTNLWTQTGEVQTTNAEAWITVRIDLSAYVGQTVKLRIQGITGNDFESDIAIDDIYMGNPIIPNEYTAYYESFDKDDGGWSVVTSNNDSWTWTNSYPVSVTDELAEGGFWRNSSYNTYPANTDIVIESPSIDFTGLQNLKFNIDVSYLTESTVDGMRILYSIAGGAYTALGASGSGNNWYEGSAGVFSADAWSNTSHPNTPTFTGPYSHFATASINLSDTDFAGQSNVRFRVQFSSDGSVSSRGVAFDNVRIEAAPDNPLNDASVAPASVTSNLRLWLKANEGISVTDGNPLTDWEDQAYDTALDKEDATAVATIAPTYRDNANRNINYNPIADFDNTATQYMNGKGGFFSQDYFVVVRSDDTVEPQTGSFTPGRQFPLGGRFGDSDFHEDPTGLAFGSSTGRYTDELIAHNMNSYANGATAAPAEDQYGRAYTSATETFNHVMVLNVKENAAGTGVEIYKNGKRIDNTTGQAGNGTDLSYYTFENISFIIGAGRSGLNGRTTSQLNGMLGEVVTYNAPNTVTDKQKIQSYLGIKYGVTLQADASALTDYRENDVDYIDSNGGVFWDTSANTAHNYDVAGIGRDDRSILLQKQSVSQNLEADGTGPTSGFLSMALTDTYATNNANISGNATTFNDLEFLVWGNNNASLDGAAVNVMVDMSEDIVGDPTLITNVEFTAIPRTWKVIETGGDIPSVEVSIPTSIVRTAAPPNGRYLMFISATGVFDPTADYRVMTETGGMLYADYDFDGTEYITFGWAPERTFERSIYFDPSNGDYIDVEDHLDLNTTGFTISSWIKREATNTTILSKRNSGFSTGYDLRIRSNQRLWMRWYNGGSLQQLLSSVSIPASEWHHVAVIYDGTTATMYIDGVEDTSAALSPPTATTESFFIGAGGKNAPNDFFDGNIDEVRIWDTNLSEDQLHYIMNQEIEDNAAFVGGKYFLDRSITPTKDDSDTIAWTSLAGYYPMSTYTYTNTKDNSGNGHQGALKNLKTVDRQTAPLPYLSETGGDWDDTATWTNGDVQTIPGTSSIVDSDISIDWNIVRTSHNVDINDDSDLPTDNQGNRTLLALFVDSNEIVVDGDNTAGTGYGLTVTHYLNLDGDIDLEGESQLIQSLDSDLEVDSSGTLEKDQQGTRDLFTYDYWAAPVGVSSTSSNNTSYTLPDVLRNGTNPATPNAITFLTTGYDGATSGSDISIADYWIWKFNNLLDDDYASWQHVRSTGTLQAGEGYTMKGVFDTAGNVIDEQNYTFIGKPNNSVINLNLNAGNDYLVGNPYPSAIDAIQFIRDNGPELDFTGSDPETDPLISGTLYFWDHWGGASHNLGEYLGGYATYNFSGAVAAATYGTNDPDVGTGGSPIYLPTRYIPPGKGFFVVGENTGQITFNNGQRIYSRESDPATRSNASSTSQADANDPRTKLRIGFNSVGTIHRQLLVTVDPEATLGKDWGFDAISNEDQIDDLYWMIDDEKYVIQGIDDIVEDTVLPLAVKTTTEGINTILIDELSNVSDELEIYLHDKELELYHDLRGGGYEIFLTEGDYLDRFEITFTNLDSLGLGENDFNVFDVHYTNSIESIVIMNPKLREIKTVKLFNILGQSVYENDKVITENHTELKVENLSSGTYIIKIETNDNEIISKKVLIN